MVKKYINTIKKRDLYFERGLCSVVEVVITRTEACEFLWSGWEEGYLKSARIPDPKKDMVSLITKRRGAEWAGRSLGYAPAFCSKVKLGAFFCIQLVFILCALWMKLQMCKHEIYLMFKLLSNVFNDPGWGGGGHVFITNIIAELTT